MNILPKILIVDDDQEIAKLLVERLSAYGFDSYGVGDSTAMHVELSKTNYTLVILDIMLKGENGLEICKDLRSSKASYNNIPVIFLSALGDTSDKIVGLEFGGDDYISKPFETRELVARIKAILRRSDDQNNPNNQSVTVQNPSKFMDKQPHTFFSFGLWTLNTAARHLIDDTGLVVPLSAVEFKLLYIFLQHPQQVLTREYLVEYLMGNAQNYDRSLDTQISRLRVKLRDDARKPSLIRTMRGDGYMLAVPVAVK